jgi:hypothetical protein
VVIPSEDDTSFYKETRKIMPFNNLNQKDFLWVCLNNPTLFCKRNELVATSWGLQPFNTTAVDHDRDESVYRYPDNLLRKCCIELFRSGKATRIDSHQEVFLVADGDLEVHFKLVLYNWIS